MRKTSVLVFLAFGVAATGAAADVCSTLQQQYIAAGSTNPGAVDVAALNRSLQAAQASAQANHCTGFGFSLFGPRPAPYCNLIMQEVGRLQNQIRTASASGGNRGGYNGGLGSIYSYADPRSPKELARATLIANGCPVPETSSGTGGANKSICVRTCDGYYFPVETGVSRSRFPADAQTCAATYGDASMAQLFVMPSDGDVAAAVPVNGGKPYGSQPYAFLYRNTYDAACAGQLPAGVGALTARLATPVPANGAPAAVANPAPSGPPVPLPQLRAMATEDPETRANLAGDLHPLQAVEVARARETGIRIVGAGYYNDILDGQAPGVPAAPATGKDTLALARP